MNKWQKKYCDEYYNGKMPRSKVDKKKFELLGLVKDVVIVEFPECNGHPAHTETLVVTEDDCNIPEGIISVSVLASNLILWTSRGYKITTK